MKNKIKWIPLEKLPSIAQQRNVLVAILDGNAIQSWAAYWSAIAAAFSFPPLPSYMQPDYHSYYDLMTDLHWIPEEQIVLIIRNAACFLQKDPQTKAMLIEDFERYLLPFWESEVEQTVVDGKKRSFQVWLVEESNG